MRIGIRAALHDSAGMGHLSRCLALAQALQENGHEVVFVAPAPAEWARRRLASADVEVIATSWPSGASSGDQEWPPEAQISDSSTTTRLLAAEGIEAVFVDDYGLGRAWDRASGAHIPRIGTVEDFHNRERACHLVVDTVGGRRSVLGDREEALSGPRYAMLGREVRDLRESQDAVRGDGTVVTFLGAGAAACAAWPGVIPDLRALAGDGFRVHAVTPDACPDFGPATDRLSFSGVTDELGGLLAATSLLVAGGGVTALEAACLGRPSLLLELASNQLGTIELLTGAGAARGIGPASDLSSGDLQAAIVELLRSGEGRKGMATAGRRLVDGLGAPRVALAFAGPGTASVTVRPTTTADEDLYYDWFMDPATRAASLETER